MAREPGEVGEAEEADGPDGMPPVLFLFVGLLGRLSPWWGPGVALAFVSLVGSFVGTVAVEFIIAGLLFSLGALLVLARMHESVLLPALSATWGTLALLLAAALLR